jgi:hypothetical protein
VAGARCGGRHGAATWLVARDLPREDGAATLGAEVARLEAENARLREAAAHQVAPASIAASSSYADP